MSVHNEVNNLFKNTLGDAPLSIRSRSGDTEDGNAYFDMRASTAPNALEVLEEKDGSTARKKFLYAYFTLLKERLNRFEFEYVKQLYVEGQAESVICNNLGLNPKKFKRGLQKKLSASGADIAALVEASDWDDAELFSKCFLSAPQDIQDVNELAYLPKTVKGFGNLIERLAYRRYRKIYKKEWYRRRDYTRIRPSTRYNRGDYYNRTVKGLVEAITVMFRTFSYDFLKEAADTLNAEQDKSTFELFFRAMYDSLNNCIQKLYQIVIERIPPEQIEQAERQAGEERRRAWEAEDEREAVQV